MDAPSHWKRSGEASPRPHRGAPISWGVSETPGWGYQTAPLRVFQEMQSLGMRTSEMGPHGYFALDDVAEEIRGKDFTIVAGFVVLGFRFPGGLVNSSDDLELTFGRLRDAGATFAVIAIASDEADYESRPRLQGGQWRQVSDTLKAVQEIAERKGLQMVLHPHFGTFIETADHACRILEQSKVGLCLDTGHLALAGDDPLDLAERVPGRIKHVHLKDVDTDLAARVRGGDLSYHEAVKAGLFQPLGRGGARIRQFVTHLEVSGYEGWYVLEQDVALPEEPPLGDGPMLNSKASLDYLAAIGLSL